MINEEQHSLREWAEITGISENTLRSRRNRGWNITDMLTKPLMANRFSYKDGTLVNSLTIVESDKESEL